MKTFKHLTLAYVKNRIVEIAYHLMFPNEPWLTKSANSIISSYIRNTHVALEFGSGRSTVWLAKRVNELVSVEHNKKWFNLVSKKLQEENITNVKYFLCEHDKNLKKNNKGYESEYVQVANKYQDEHFDLILVDGTYRSSCALIAVKKLRKSGILIVDNINWYLPSNKTSPNSIPINSGTLNEEWGYFAELVNDWKLEWTTNGVTDTAIWYKPI